MLIISNYITHHMYSGLDSAGDSKNSNSHYNKHNGNRYHIKKAIEFTTSLGIILQSPKEAMFELDSIEGPQRKYQLTRGIAIYVLDKDVPTVYFYTEKNSPIIKNISSACSKDRWILPIRDSNLEKAISFAKRHNDVYLNPPDKIKLDNPEDKNQYSDIICSILGDANKIYDKYTKRKEQPRLVNLLSHEAYAEIGKDNADIRCIGLDTMHNILIINALDKPLSSYGMIQEISFDSTKR